MEKRGLKKEPLQGGLGGRGGRVAGLIGRLAGPQGYLLSPLSFPSITSPAVDRPQALEATSSLPLHPPQAHTAGPQ